MKIIKEDKSPLLGRRRLSINVEHYNNKTPDKATIKQKLADQYKHDPEAISVRHIYSKFGRGVSKIIAHLYDKKETKEFLEPIKVKKEKKKK